MMPDTNKSRLQIVREGGDTGVNKRGRLVVGIARVVEDPHNERKTFRNMDGLIASIRAVGLIEPITVTPEAGGVYRIITGHRRFRASKAAGLEMVEVLIREPEEEAVRRQKSVVSNVQREDIGPVEMAEALQALLDEDESIDSQQKLAEIIGKDKTWVSRMLRILDLPPAIQRRVASTQRSLAYDAVAEIARLDDLAAQEALIDELLRGASQREIRQKIREFKGKPSKTKPKRVYSTSQRATVIVQSQTASLSRDRARQALQEALEQSQNDKSLES